MFRQLKCVEQCKTTREQIIALLRALPNRTARVQVLAAACHALRIMREANQMFEAMLEGDRIRRNAQYSREEQIILARRR